MSINCARRQAGRNRNVTPRRSYRDNSSFEITVVALCSILALSLYAIEDLQAQVHVSAGLHHSCAVGIGGSVRCWGRSLTGQLGYGNNSSIGDNEFPYVAGDVDVGALVDQVSAGASHTCAVTSTDTVRCWGYGGWGRLGYGNESSVGVTSHPSSAGDVTVGFDVDHVSAGGSHTCAVSTDNRARCWGKAEFGRLGYGNTNDIGDDETPASAGDIDLSPTSAYQISAGDEHTCVVTTGAQIVCWGKGEFGKLGYGNISWIGDNEAVTSSGAVNISASFIQVSAGRDHTCARTYLTNKVYCWGLNVNGQLGYGNTDNIGDNEIPNTAGEVDVGAGVIDISAGGLHTCAVTVDNNVRCWGYGGDGALGYGNTDNIGDNELPSTAGDVDVGVGVVRVFAGDRHTCVLTVDNTVRCWGDGLYGQTGYASTNDIGDNEVPADSGDVFVEKPLPINVGVLLEGPYTGPGGMSTTINGSIPLTHPYADSTFLGTPLFHPGSGNVSSMPGDAVDWVLIHLRMGDPANPPMETVATRAALLESDGTVVGPQGGNLPVFHGVPDTSYYVAIDHLNHLSVMTPTAVTAVNDTLSHDFTTGLAQAYTGGGAAMKDLSGGIWGMFAADENGDGQVTAPDFNGWNAATTAGLTGYQLSDFNRDGIVTAPDFNLWNANTTAGAASQVPD